MAKGAERNPVFNRRMVLMLLGCLLLFGGIFAFKMFGKVMMNRAFDNMPLPAATVTAARVERQLWQQTLSAVGTMRAVNGVEVTTRAQGVVKRILFDSGQRVEKGDLLAELSAEPEKAQLDVLEAELRLARRDHDRIKALHVRGVTTDAELDETLSKLEQVLANIRVQREEVEKRTVVAPFSGRLGIRRVDLGQNVAPGDPVVSLQQMNPIFVDFYLPEQALSQIKVGLAINVTTDTYPEKTFPGKVSAISPRIDNASRNVLVQATMDNPGDLLRPGMFADVTLDLPGRRALLVVPRTAVSFSPYGNAVFVLKKDPDGGGLIAHKRFVKTGEERGNLVEIIEGVQEGARVATSGLLKLRNRGPVRINNENEMPVKLNPRPGNS
ncbi:efflux RND transporter periplasmic adaptor subunit [Microbulbifer yueqingensis]|uniref:Membrane fusion protein, multidrug efflux system n=1 Tax=Microbulbifer yueqingensis TaxID=658219 RepID=A0A1G9EXE0_9GAMM|nr:efflux RND transporter periplasmic adaptor subunit [Microbulbifer yueqingensis]SDK80665.1 membrane fusion protein, multidrug efflux system [Microbulbifer yueqingensis]